MILIDGRDSHCVDPMDRGLHYGDGLFETIAIVNGAPRLWSRHLQRLSEGCRRLAIPQPDSQLLATEAHLCSKGCQRGILKLMITRASGGTGYATGPAQQPRRILMMRPWPERPPEYQQDGVEVRYCETPLGDNPRLAGLKHLNRLEQILARNEWDDPQISEGLMSSQHGDVVEGTFTNLFIIEGPVVLTPPVERHGVAGVMRGLVLDQCQELDIPVQIERLNRERLAKADAVFLTNAVIGIWPVRKLETSTYPCPHPLITQLQRAIEGASEPGDQHA